MKAKKTGVKAFVLVIAIALLIGCVAGGTIAYLMTKTTPVVNTFVAGDIGTLTLTENTGDEYLIVPGKDIIKDPELTYEDFNVASYVFLKVDAADWAVTENNGVYTYSIGTDDTSANPKIEKEMKWTLSGWTMLENGVYYKTVAADSGTQTWKIIDGDTITVESGITMADLANDAYEKSLTFTAYAIQQTDGGSDNEGNFTPAEAWNQVKTLG